MTARYEVQIYSTGGVLLYSTQDYNSLEYNKLLNATGNHTISFRMDVLDALGIADSVFSTDNFFVVRRSDLQYGMDWYIDYEGFHRTIQHTTSPLGLELCTAYGRTYDDLINRRSIAYKADHARSAKSAMPAETAIKEFVLENAGAAALVSAGREADGVFPNFVVETSLASGTVVTVSYPWRNLLDVVKELSTANGIYFWITRSGATFTFHASTTFGTSRIAGSLNPMIFSEAFGNMVSPSYTFSRMEEVNRVVVLGQGEDAARQIVVRDDLVAQGGSPWNVVERTHDARNTGTLAGLATEGDQELSNTEATENFAFQVLQSDTSRYGLNYAFGDVVTVTMHDIIRNKRIVGVSVKDSNGKEDLSFQFSDVAVDPDPLRQIVENLTARMRAVEVRQNL